MPRRPERIVLLRSGRHLTVALAALRAAHPGCHVTVVATPGSERAVSQAGIEASDVLIYRARPQFDAWPLWRSRLPISLWRRGYDRVAVLWQDPVGTDRANVDRAALLLAPRGFEAITPDGTVVPRSTAALLTRELSRAICSFAVLAALGLALYLPAQVARLVRGGHRSPAGTR